MPDANPLSFTLVLEDGTGLTNSNSYSSLAAANAYFAASLYASTWTSTTDDFRQRALGMATTVIDRITEFRGYQKSTEQALQWPRLECPRVGQSEFSYIAGIRRVAVYWDEASIPDILQKATAELAQLLLASDRTQEDASKGIQSLGIGAGAVDIVFNPEDRKKTLNEQVSFYLRQLGRIRGSRSSVKITRVQ